MRINKFIELFITGACLLFLSSCATIPTAPLKPQPATVYPLAPELIRHDIFHTVAPGETLWRIGKIYDVRIEDIMRANNLSDKDKLSMGQRLLIPQALPASSIIPLYPSNKWKYIVIHHSATDVGNALTFTTLISEGDSLTVWVIILLSITAAQVNPGDISKFRPVGLINRTARTVRQEV